MFVLREEAVLRMRARSIDYRRLIPHVLHSQAEGVVVRGSLAYVTGRDSNSLVVVKVTDPAAPTIVGSVSSSSEMARVRPRVPRRPLSARE